MYCYRNNYTKASRTDQLLHPPHHVQTTQAIHWRKKAQVCFNHAQISFNFVQTFLFFLTLCWWNIQGRFSVHIWAYLFNVFFMLTASITPLFYLAPQLHSQVYLNFNFLLHYFLISVSVRRILCSLVLIQALLEGFGLKVQYQLKNVNTKLVLTIILNFYRNDWSNWRIPDLGTPIQWMFLSDINTSFFVVFSPLQLCIFLSFILRFVT